MIDSSIPGIGVHRISKFLRVVTCDTRPGERGVMSNDHKLIAVLSYDKRWREWVLNPEPNTMWSGECLASIHAQLAALNSDGPD